LKRKYRVTEELFQNLKIHTNFVTHNKKTILYTAYSFCLE